MSTKGSIFQCTWVIVYNVGYCHSELLRSTYSAKMEHIFLGSLLLMRSLPTDSNLFPNIAFLCCSCLCYSYIQVPGQTDEYLRTLCACLVNNLGWNMQLAKFSSNVYFQGFTGDLNPKCYSLIHT